MKLDTNGPLYKHDCEECAYLGSELVYHKPVDVYYCPVQKPYPSMVVRHGNEGHEYSSCDTQTLTAMETDLATMWVMMCNHKDLQSQEKH